MARFDPASARRLAGKIDLLRTAAGDFASFAEREPGLASDCGVEVQALEARSILSGGAPERIARAAFLAAESGRPAAVEQADLDSVERLERVTALAAERIDQRRRALEAQVAPAAALGSLVEKLAPMLGGIVVDRAFGLLKSIF